MQHLKNVARQFAAWEPDVVEEIEDEVVVPSTAPVLEVEAPTSKGLCKETTCIGCGQQVDTANSVSCFRFPCSVEHMNLKYTRVCSDDNCDETFCCPRHLK